MKAFATIDENIPTPESLFYNGTIYTRTYFGVLDKEYVVTLGDIPFDIKGLDLPHIEVMLNKTFQVKDMIFLREGSSVREKNSLTDHTVTNHTMLDTKVLAIKNNALSIILLDVVSQIVADAESEVHDDLADFLSCIERIQKMTEIIKSMQDIKMPPRSIEYCAASFKWYIISAINQGHNTLTSMKDLTALNKI